MLRSILPVLALCCAVYTPARTGPAQESTTAHQVFAVRFASIRYSVGQLVAGGDRQQPIDIAMMVWPIKMAGGGVMLVDAGFYRQKFVEQWKPTSYARPTDALKAALGISPEDVTDVVLSHVHWDHGDGADLFPQARIWIQERRQNRLIASGA